MLHRIRNVVSYSGILRRFGVKVISTQVIGYAYQTLQHKTACSHYQACKVKRCRQREKRERLGTRPDRLISETERVEEVGARQWR